MQRSYPSDEHYMRWARIKRLTPTQLEQLHCKEIQAKNEFDAAVKNNRLGILTPNPGITFEWFMRPIEKMRGPMWAPKVTREVREVESERWRSHIYRLWRKVWDRYDASSDKLSGQPGFYGQLDALQDIDNIIHADGYEFPPANGGVAVDAVTDQFKSKGKARAADGYQPEAE